MESNPSNYVVIFLLIVVVVSSGCTKINDKTEKEKSINQSNSEVDQDSQNLKRSRTYSVGTQFSMGGVWYKIEDFSIEDKVGEMANGIFTGTEADGKYFIVNITVTNERENNVNLNPAPMLLITDEKEYYIDSDTIGYMDDALTYTELNSGEQLEKRLAYDIPSSVSKNSIELKINAMTAPEGMDLEKPHYVTFN